MEQVIMNISDMNIGLEKQSMFQWLIQINSKTLFSSLLLLVVPIALLAQPENYIKNEGSFQNHIVDRLVVSGNDIYIVGTRYDYDSTESLINRTSLWVAKLGPDSMITQSYYYQSAEQWLIPLQAQINHNKLYIYCRSAHNNNDSARYLIKTYQFDLLSNQIIDSNEIDIIQHVEIGVDTTTLDLDRTPCNISTMNRRSDSLLLVGSIMMRSKQNPSRLHSRSFVIIINKYGNVMMSIRNGLLDTSQVNSYDFRRSYNTLTGGVLFNNKITTFTYYDNFIFIYVFDFQGNYLKSISYNNTICPTCFIMPVTSYAQDGFLYAVGMVMDEDRSEYLQSVKYDTNLNVLATQPIDVLMPGTEAVYYRDIFSNRQFFTQDDYGLIYLYYTHNSGVMNFAKLNSNLELIWAKRIDARPNNMAMSHRSVNVIGDKIYAYGNYCNDYTSIPFPSCSDTGRHAYIYVMDTSGVITSSESIQPQTNAINIFPNPSLGKMNIDGLPKNASIYIYDINGRLVFGKTEMSEAESINIQHKGLLIYEIKNSNNELLKRGKILVQ
jgi:hypothetical protein